jgi:hypothetical protein
VNRYLRTNPIILVPCFGFFLSQIVFLVLLYFFNFIPQDNFLNAIYLNVLILITAAIIFRMLSPKNILLRLPRPNSNASNISLLLLVIYAAAWLLSGGIGHRDQGIVTSAQGIFYITNSINSLFIILPTLIMVLSPSTYMGAAKSVLIILAVSILADSRGVMIQVSFLAFLLIYTIVDSTGKRLIRVDTRAIGFAVLALFVFTSASAVRNIDSDSDISGALRGVAFSVDRIAEGSTNRINDTMFYYQGSGGFENFERLKYIFVPSVLLTKEKLSLKDGAEKMQDYFSVGSVQNQQVPMMIHYDALFRFGYVVAILLTAIFFIIVPATIIKMFGNFKTMGLVFIVSKSTTLFGMYAFSVLGTAHVLFYDSVKELIIIFLIIASIKKVSTIKDK